MEINKIKKTAYVIQKFSEEEKLEDAKPKDLMPNLIDKGFF